MERIGEYEIVRTLGSGGFGVVYLAQDCTSGQQVAVKCLHHALRSDQLFRRKFRAEVLALQQLSHPHIVRFISAGESSSQFYIVTEYLDGESLRELLNRGPLAWRRALDLMQQVGGALKAAHQFGIMHGDIKPENVFVLPGRGAVLLDFGLARFADDSSATRTAQIMGTWKYMAPEQLRGERGDHRSDLFACGIMLYELLTGTRPFGGSYDAAVVYSILNEEPRPLDCQLFQVPVSLKGIINQALRKDPAQRYQDLETFITDLKTVAEGKTIAHLEAESTKTSLPELRSLAVLLPRSLSGDEYNHLAFGIADELVSRLARVSDLRVPPMRSILAFQGSALGSREIAAQLGVRLLIDGTLAHRDSMLFLSVQLVDAEADRVLWSTNRAFRPSSLVEACAQMLPDIFAVLGISPDQVTTRTPVKPGTAPGLSGYELHLRARYLFEHKTSAEDVQVAAGLFEQAIARDPSFSASIIGLARVLIHQGFAQLAVQKLEALAASRTSSQQDDEGAEIELALAEAKFRLSDWKGANEHAFRARNMAVAGANLELEAKALTILIDIYEPQAKYDEALALYQRIVRINQQRRRRDKLTAAVKSIAVLHHHRGRYGLALHHYNEALELCRLQEQVDIEAKLLNNIGLVHHHLGRDVEAADCFEHALAIHKRIGEFGSVAVNLNNLGVVRFSAGDYQAALSLFVEAEKTAGDVGDRKNYSLALENQGKTHALLGNYEQARQFNETALSIAMELGFQIVAVMAERNLGDICLYQRKFAEADTHYARALIAAESSDLKHEQLIVLLSQVKLRERQEDFKACRRLAEQSLRLSRELRMRRQAHMASAYRAYAEFRILRHPGLIRKLEAITESRAVSTEPPYRIAGLRILAIALKLSGDEGLALKASSTSSVAMELAQRFGLRYEIEWLSEASI